MLNHDYLILLTVIIALSASTHLIANKLRTPIVALEIIIGMIISLILHSNPNKTYLIHDNVIVFLATFGSLLLLFIIGLETKLTEIAKVGKDGAITAIIGIILPFALGILVTHYIFQGSWTLAIFIGACLSATSTGISLRVFKELNILNKTESKIVLGASVIDDILGLLILAVLTGFISSGSLNLSEVIITISKIVGFILLCQIIISRLIHLIQKKLSHKLEDNQTFSLLFLIATCLAMSYLAELAGISGVIGAFFAGIIVRQGIDLYHSKTILEQQTHMVEVIAKIFTPIFFIYAGMQIDINILLNLNTVIIGSLLSIAAIIGKILCGSLINKRYNKWIVGVAMIPRGEIGLIFAISGRSIGILNQEYFAAIMLMVLVTTLITPFMLNKVIKNSL